MNKPILAYLGLGELSAQGLKVVFSFWLILVLSFFLFGDQNLISPNLQNIGKSLGLQTNAEIDWYLGGVIPVFFFVLGGVVSICMGYFSQKYSRKRLLIISVLLGEIPCLLTSFSTSYTEFFIYRVLCGFGLGGLFPILFSIIGDYFTSKSRVIASAYISLAMGCGIGIGQLIGGIFGDIDPVNGWRLSFIVMSVPSFFFLVLYAFFCEEPVRGKSDFEDINSEPKNLNHEISFQEFKKLIQKKTNLSILLQGIPGCVPWGVFFIFLVDYYEKIYSLSKIEASGLLTFAAIGIFVGTFLGGIIGQRLFNKNPTYQPIFILCAIFLGIFPCLYLLFAGNSVKSFQFVLINIITGIIISFPIANVRSMLISVNLPKERSTIFAIYNLTDDLGRGLGPAFSAIILTLIPERSTALAFSILFWIPCAILWLPAIYYFKKEENELRLEMQNL